MKNYPLIQIARVVVETEGPISIGSGETDVFFDMPIVRDANNLPYLPGTSVAGVLRHLLSPHFDEPTLEEVFGIQRGSDGQVARLIFSSGHLIGSDGQAAEGLLPTDRGLFKDTFLNSLMYRGIEKRDRVRINHRGTYHHGAKFDMNFLVPGARFVFDVKFYGEAHHAVWQKLLSLLASGFVQVGRNTRNGFGKLKVVDLLTTTFDLSKMVDLEAYAKWTGSLNASLPNTQKPAIAATQSTDLLYTLELQPADFFLFSSGKKDGEEGAADISGVRGKRITWKGSAPKIEDAELIVPATSVKGALAHRTLYHLHKLEGLFAGEEWVSDDSEARKKPIAPLFGMAANEKEKEAGYAGALWFSDVYLKSSDEHLVQVAHVSIDPLTQGNIQGALFQEEVVDSAAFPNQIYTLQIRLQPEKVLVEAVKKQVLFAAFEAALSDLASGLLPLGGAVNRGHGRFNGTIKKS
jgi:CRISPR/Cas system CMR subunit Cmr4 (Cas7 group RAMP superfamily)